VKGGNEKYPSVLTLERMRLVDFKVMKMECQVNKNDYYGHILLFTFNRGCKAAKAARDICAVYGDDAITERTV